MTDPPIDIKKPLHRTSLLSFREILIGGSSYAAIASRMQSLHDLSEVPFIISRSRNRHERIVFPVFS